MERNSNAQVVSYSEYFRNTKFTISRTGSFPHKKISALNITWNTASGVSDVFGGSVNLNSYLTITEKATLITCTLRSTSTLPAFGNNAVGFRITRKAAIANNTAQAITIAISNTSGGESNPNNNSVSASVTAQ